MLTTSNWSNEIFKQCQTTDGCVYIPFNIGKWLFVGCIIFSFLLASLFPNSNSWLFSFLPNSWHTSPGKPRKSSLVEIFLMHSPMLWPTITTPSVGLSYCQIVNAYQFLSLGSYDHFCFFDHISNSTKTSDDFAFFVFFVFKSNRLHFVVSFKII